MCVDVVVCVCVCLCSLFFCVLFSFSLWCMCGVVHEHDSWKCRTDRGKQGTRGHNATAREANKPLAQSKQMRGKENWTATVLVLAHGFNLRTKYSQFDIT